MNKKHFSLLIGLLGFTLFLGSCKKAGNPADDNAFKKGWVTGKWQQTDLVFSVDIPLAGQTIAAGTSLISVAPLIGQALGNPVIAQLIVCTKGNQYDFRDDGNFIITGCTDLILPVAGSQGSWELTIYDAVLQLTSMESEKDPHWINTITPTNMELAITLTIPGVGSIPLGLQLKKIQ